MGNFIFLALGSDRELKLWPGDVVDDVGSRDAFRALLGSPNGRGVGWLLAAHKGAQQLGCKVVKSIHVFADGGPAAVLSDIPCMAFEIVDCPADAAAGSAANPPTKRVEERGAGNVRSVVIKLLADIRKSVQILGVARVETGKLFAILTPGRDDIPATKPIGHSSPFLSLSC
ncbi:hypothetical protein LTR28_005447 [Elasticomyces elasticus]|nr:hypothetical protein LTR28_005447 [Elasticomyces elasticus]